MSFKKNMLLQLRDAIPESLRGSFGSDIYTNYVRLRTALLSAEVKTFGMSRPIEYALIDKGKAERVVFLHGFADCKENFFDSAHRLVSDFDLLIPDLPGFGNSFKSPEQTYDLAHYADWLCELFDSLGWTSFHLVGNSLGAAIAIRIAVTRPQLVKSLTLIDPAGIVLPGHESIYDEFLNDRVVFEIHSHVQFEYFLNRVFQKPPVIPPFVWDHLYDEFSKNSKWNRKILFDLLEGITAMDDHRLMDIVLNNTLKHIAAPTLILWGDKDSFFPYQTGELAQNAIPGASLEILHGLGHSPQNESPMRVMRIVKKFLKKHC